ncbi:MAG TPA: hypothetical protein VIO64_14130 [Pseudobacteroides sp.]
MKSNFAAALDKMIEEGGKGGGKRGNNGHRKNSKEVNSNGNGNAWNN